MPIPTTAPPQSHRELFCDTQATALALSGEVPGRLAESSCGGRVLALHDGGPGRARRRAWWLWLAWGELRVRRGRGEVGGGGGGGEADHRAVDVHADRAVGGGLAGGR